MRMGFVGACFAVLVVLAGCQASDGGSAGGAEPVAKAEGSLSGTLTANLSVAPPSAGSTTLKFVNHTPFWLTFYVDGEKSVSVPPGDQGFAVTTPGRHTLRADAIGKGLSTNRTVDLTAEGGVWTVDYRKT
jgi:hypothetical protein